MYLSGMPRAAPHVFVRDAAPKAARPCRAGRAPRTARRPARS